MRTETVRNVMAATRCAVFAFKRVSFIPHPASDLDLVAGVVADGFSLLERLIFQSVSKNISLQLEREVGREVWNSVEADSWAVLSNNWEQYCCEIQGNAFAFSDG